MERKLRLTAGEAFALERLRRLRGARVLVAPFWGSRFEGWSPVACGSLDGGGGGDRAVEDSLARLMRQTRGRAAAKVLGRSYVFTGRASFGAVGGTGPGLVLDGRILCPVREWSVDLGRDTAGRVLEALLWGTVLRGTPRVLVAGFRPHDVEPATAPGGIAVDAFLTDGPLVGRRLDVDPDRAARTVAEVLRDVDVGVRPAPYGFHMTVSPEGAVLRLWLLEPERADRWRIELRPETGRQALRSCTARHRNVHPGPYLLKALEDLFGEVRLPTGLAGDRFWEDPPWLAHREKGWRLGAWLQTTYLRCGELADPALALYVCEGDGSVSLEREGGRAVGAREVLKVPGEALVRVLVRCGSFVGVWAEDGEAVPILDAVVRPEATLSVRTVVRAGDGPRLAWAWCWARREDRAAVPLLARSREALRRARSRSQAERLFG